MATETTPATRAYATASDLYLGWVNATVDANERIARVARIWIDESVAAQKDLAQAIKKGVDELRSNIDRPAEVATPAAWLSRSGDLARTNYTVWSQVALKAQERYAKVAQAMFTELQDAGSEFAGRVQKNISSVTRAGNGAASKN